MARKVWIIQRPKHGDNFDMGAVEALGEVNYLIPAAPNIHDADRIREDIKHMAATIRENPDDVFVTLGGSPLSQMMFGAAFVLSDVNRINYGLFSRGQDVDGRRDGQNGSYRIVPVDLYADIPESPLAATPGQGAH